MHTAIMKGLFALAGIAVASMLVSFGSNPDTTPAAQLATITVSPAIDTVGTGDSVRYTAVGRDAVGHVVPITPVWSVSSAAGTIDADGLFTPGTVDALYPNSIIAVVGSVVGHASVIIDCGC